MAFGSWRWGVLRFFFGFERAMHWEHGGCIHIHRKGSANTKCFFASA